jgi:hypothetical protein
MPSKEVVAYKDPEDMTTRSRTTNKTATGVPATPTKLHILITGPGQTIERTIDMGNATAKAAPILFSLDGKHELTIVVTSTP